VLNFSILEGFPRKHYTLIKETCLLHCDVQVWSLEVVVDGEGKGHAGS
jgi:hypothetical protein